MGKEVLGVILSNESEPQVAGSNISGVFFVEVAKEISARKLKAYLTGEEKTTVRYNVNDREGQLKTRYADAHRRFFIVELPVKDDNMIHNGKISAGKYELPFQVELPASLPSSFVISGDGGKCEIMYTISATLKGSGLMSDYKCSRDVKVIAKPSSREAVPYDGEPVTESVELLCCINRGSITFAVRVADTVLEKGDSIVIAMSCRNLTSARIERVYAIVTENVTWYASGQRNWYSKKLGKIDFGRMEGLDQSQGGGFTPDLADMRKEVEDGTNSGMVLVPESACDTYASQLIQAQHFIDVNIETRCCVDNPHIRIPLEVRPHHNSTTIAPTTTVHTGLMDGATITSTAYIPLTAAVIGGGAIDSSGRKAEDTDIAMPDRTDVLDPSVPNLLKELEESVNDLDIIETKIENSAWRPVLSSLSPSDYASVIKKVDLDFDQPRIAKMLAPVIKEGQFTSEYVVEATRATSDWNRSAVVGALLPYCVDLQTGGQQKILAELSDWEKMVTKQAFENALKG